MVIDNIIDKHIFNRIVQTKHINYKMESDNYKILFSIVSKKIDPSINP